MEPYKKTAALVSPVASMARETGENAGNNRSETWDFNTVDWEHLSDANARPLLAMEIKRLQRNEAKLTQKLKQTEMELEVARKNLVEMDHLDRDRVVSLVQTLKQATQRKCTDDYLEHTIKDSPIVTASKFLEGGKVLSSEHATEVVISSLVDNLRVLALKNEKLNADNLRLYSAAADLECENEAHEYKIDVLETQFKTINKTRQKVVSRLTKASAKVA